MKINGLQRISSGRCYGYGELSRTLLENMQKLSIVER